MSGTLALGKSNRCLNTTEIPGADFVILCVLFFHTFFPSKEGPACGRCCSLGRVGPLASRDILPRVRISETPYGRHQMALACNTMLRHINSMLCMHDGHRSYGRILWLPSVFSGDLTAPEVRPPLPKMWFIHLYAQHTCLSHRKSLLETDHITFDMRW
jgi:hypothetical protein